jgi:hypothetical protein
MCTTAIALGIAFASEGIPTKPYSIGFVSGFLALVILRFEGQRDLDAVLVLVIAFLAFLAMGVGIYLIAADHSGLVPKVSFALCTTGAVTLGVWSYRRQKTESPNFPNLLARSVHRASIFEAEGVQFTGYLEPAQGGKPHLISILLQNCFDSPCEVTLNFDTAGKGAYMRLHDRLNMTLAGGDADVRRGILSLLLDRRQRSEGETSQALARARGDDACQAHDNSRATGLRAPFSRRWDSLHHRTDAL